MRTDDWPEMSEKQRAIIEAWLSAKPETAQGDIARAVGVSDAHVSQTLHRFSDFIAEESTRRIGHHVPAVDQTMIEAAKTGKAEDRRLFYQRLGLLIDKSEQIHSHSLPRHEQATIEEEGDLDALAERLPGLLEFLGHGPDGPAESGGLPEGAGASSDATAEAPADVPADI